MFMSKKDKAYYKLNMLGDIQAGKTLYWLNWVNAGLLILTLFAGELITVFILAILYALNIFLWCKGRDRFCANIEKQIIADIVNKKINRFALKYPGLNRDEIVEKYVESEDSKGDLELVSGVIREFYENL